MYSPTLGRFITADPIGFQAGDVNLYRFVGNSPTNATDPSGTQETKGTTWKTQGGPGVDLGRFNYRGATWKSGDATCKGDVNIIVYGYRTFKTYVGDNNPENFRVFVQFKISYKNVTCSVPCEKDYKVDDWVYYAYSTEMKGIFLEGELSAYTTRFKQPKDFDQFLKEYLDGYYKLKPAK